MTLGIVRLLFVLALVVATPAALLAQRGRGGGAPPGPPPSPQASAPIDLTGYWVSIVNEDWRWRMITPPKGDYSSIANLMTPEASKLADAWEPSQDGSCLAYGAAGLMRMPTRLNITWEDASTLRIETDAGQQTRRLMFDAPAPPGPRSLQGLSVAEWERPGRGGRGGGGFGGPPPGGPPPDAARPGGPPAPGGGGPGVGNLKVVTTNLSGGWLRRNGVPYSDAATMTEYVDRFATAGGDQWLVVTTIVSDPKYLTQEFVTSTHFKREADGAKKWAPTPCKPVG